MNTIKPLLRKIIYTIPGTQRFWIWLNNTFGANSRPDFSGWGMSTHTYTPWHNGYGDELAKGFLATHQEMTDKVKLGEIQLSLFNRDKNKNKQLQALMWRHYIVYWSARYAAYASSCPTKNLVECGVCDGMSAYFAMCAVRGKYEFKSYLYDAWEGMKKDWLLESESGAIGNYSFLSLENTQKNLAEFSTQSIFIKGYIPETFATTDSADEIVWLHIDLNSSLPTTAALKFFFDKLQPGGVILFDDYAWHDFIDTKLAIDLFCADKNGMLMPLPTGQALYFK